MTAQLRLDHVVILVSDLDAASADYTALGFTVVPGGAHANGLTHNALIAFADGTYLELIARVPGVAQPSTEPPSRLLRSEPDEGLADFALLTPDLAATVAEARGRGLALADPAPSGRNRPDGQRLGWASSFPSTPDLPFLIQDTTPRPLRVPQGTAQEHANGVTGIARLTIAVQDLDASIARYEALLGVAPQPWPEYDEPEVEVFSASVPLNHPQIAELQQMMRGLGTRQSEAEQAALVDAIRAKMEEGRSEALPWVGEVQSERGKGQPADRGVDFVLGSTKIALATPIAPEHIAIWPRLARHGDGPERLTLHARGLTGLQSLKSGNSAGYQASITLVPDASLAS
jgi:catechol 2,3-dioxygenase-like lactoylglutathione lyase family enzyme